MLRTFDGAVAIVTGGASGIGRALGEALAHRGAEVVLADLQSELAEEVAAAIRDRGGAARAATVDVADGAAVERLVQDTLEGRGRLDYLFNNAGIGIAGEAELYRLEDWYRVLDVNLRGVVHGVHAAYPAMLEQGFGHIVNTASMAGLVPLPGSVSYGATKHAVVGLSTLLRAEAAAKGVRVSVLCPGVVRTPILDRGGRYGQVLMELPEEFLRPFVERMRPIDAGVFAEKALRAVAANRAIIVVPRWWRVVWWLHRLSPTLGLYLGRRFHEKAKRELEAFLAARRSGG